MRCMIRPFEVSLLEQRSNLLQDCLRDNYAPYPIDREFPIVLNPENKNLSVCVIHPDTGQLLAHANYWPRVFYDRESQESFPVALLGNVATHRSFRKQGIMQQLFDYLSRSSEHRGLHALILWSDLNSFYQNLGFVPFGTEFRWTFARNFLPPDAVRNPEERVSVETKLKVSDFSRMLALRSQTSCTLKRSEEEFAKLLTIPDAVLWTVRRKEELVGFGILGKGVDMVGVLHEWGTDHPQTLATLLNAILERSRANEVMVLSPMDLSEPWKDFLVTASESCETHQMAWGKFLRETKLQDLAQNSFVWGLDSI